MYSRVKDSNFDLNYYQNTHMPMVKGYLGNACQGIQIEIPINEEQPYHVIAHLLFESFESFQKSYLPHSEVVRADIPNYTNLTPSVQMGSVVDA